MLGKTSEEFKKYKEAQKQIENKNSITELEEDLSKLTKRIKDGEK